MHFAHGDDAGQKVFPLVWIRLMDDAFISVTGGAGFIGIDSRNEDQFIFYFIIDLCQPFHIFADRIFIVGRTGADDD